MLKEVDVKRFSMLTLALILAMGMCSLCAFAQGTATLTTWSIPVHNSLPEGIAVASDGTVFFAEFVGGRIGELSPKTNMITERLVHGAPYGIVLIRDTFLYWTDSVADRIGQLSLIPNIAETQPLLNERGLARAITYGMDPYGLDAVWFLERDGNRLGALTIAGGGFWKPQAASMYSIEATRTDTELPAPGFNILQPTTTWLYVNPQNAVRTVSEVTPREEMGFRMWNLPMIAGGRPSDLVIDGSRRAIVSTENNALIAYDLYAAKFITYTLPIGTSTHGLTIDSANRIWYTDKSRSRISRIDLNSGELLEYQLPSIGWPHDLVLISRDQLVVFTEWAGNCISVIDLRTNELRRYVLPLLMSRPVSIAADATHMSAIYFTAEQGNYIGRMEWSSP